MTNVIKQIVRDGQYGTQTIKMVVRSNERGPQGFQGEPGEAATIQAGNAYTINPGSQPVVMNTGSSTNAVFDFYIPKGDKGEQGEQGIPGVVQYTAGPGIKIKDNVISATGGGGGGDGVWGEIVGDIEDQTDLQEALAAKQNQLTAGNAVTIDNDTINADIYPADFFTAGATVSATGANIALDKTIPAPLESIELYGDTKQEGTPTPAAPITAQVVTGEQTVTVNGKNLFNNSLVPKYSSGATSEVIPTGLRITATTTSGNTFCGFVLFKSSDFLNRTITLSSNVSHSAANNPNAYIGLCDENGENRLAKSWFLIGTGQKSTSYTHTEEDASRPYIMVALYSNSSSGTVQIGDYVDYANLQLEIGSTATDYEPYQSQSYTVDLGSTELCKIGNYQDYIYKSGDDWYVHKAIGRTILLGSEGNLSYSNGVLYFDEVSDNLAVGAFSNYYTYGGAATNTSSAYNNGNYKISVFNNGKRIYLRNDSLTSLSDWTTWLPTHNTSLYYALATPTDAQITDADLIADLNALAGAKSYLDVTNFTVTATGTNLPALLKPEAYAKSADGISMVAATGSDSAVQSDWNEADSTAPDYIKNKPTIPTVNNATLTIQQNGVGVATFTANSATNTTANITSPAITMTSTDPGEGADLADNNYLFVYGDAPVIEDYSLSEVNTGIKWIDGSAIYKKTINFGTGPNNTTKSVSHNISNADKFVKIEGYGVSASGYYTPIPYVPSSSTSLMDISVNSTSISMSSSDNRSNWSFYVTLYYTKSS